MDGSAGTAAQPEGLDMAASFEEDAPRPKPEDEADQSPGPGHNSEADAKAAQEAEAKRKEQDAELDRMIVEWCELQEEQERLIDLHLKEIRTRQAEIKSDANERFGIVTKAFNARGNLKLIERENEDVVVLAVNRLFRATPVGQNLDLIALEQRVREAEEAKRNAAEAKAAKKGGVNKSPNQVSAQEQSL